MELSAVKEYMRVDENDDDSMIQLMMGAAEEYIKSAVGRFDETNPKVKLLYMAAVQDMYDNRQLIAVNSEGSGVSQHFRNMFQSIVTQLQAEELLNEQEGSELNGV